MPEPRIAAERPPRALLPLLVALCVLGCVPLLWPGDTPWINDEPLFLRKALECRTAGTLATAGIVGTKGVAYGPLAIWIYTLLLHVSTDLPVLIVLRVLLVTGVTIAALLWLARHAARLRPELGALALLSPYLFLYSRQLWDNTFLIPIGALALAAYASFCARPAGYKLWITGLCLTGMLLIHLMSIGLILPIVAHCLWLQRPWLRAHLRSVAGLCGAAMLLLVPYLAALGRGLVAASQQAAHAVAGAGGATGGPPPPLLRWQGWVFPFLGGRLFSAQGLDYFFGPGWHHAGGEAPARTVRALAVLSWVALPLVWIGALLAAARVRAWLRAGRPATRDADLHLSLLGLLSLLCAVLLDGITQSFGHPHYYNATWICSFYFLWTALSAGPRTLMPLLRGAYALSLAGVLGFLIVTTHRNAGNRDIHYGTAVSDQIEIARRLQPYAPDSPVRTTVQNYVLFPHALTVLRDLYHMHGTPGGPRRPLLIRYMHEDRPGAVPDGWLTVEEGSP